jgi:glycosyltransferase involved in cell wall biosynthesis
MAQVKNAVLVIRGPGYESCARGYLQLAERAGAAGRVICLPPVPSDRVVAEARVADVGLWTLLANVGLNFELALPNKVFEYLAAGLPVLAADLPEVRQLIDQYGVGCCFDLTAPDSIARAIHALVDDDRRREQCRQNIARALDDLQADREWNKLVDLYQQIREESACASCTVP